MSEPMETIVDRAIKEAFMPGHQVPVGTGAIGPDEATAAVLWMAQEVVYGWLKNHHWGKKRHVRSIQTERVWEFWANGKRGARVRLSLGHDGSYEPIEVVIAELGPIMFVLWIRQSYAGAGARNTVYHEVQGILKHGAAGVCIATQPK